MNKFKQDMQAIISNQAQQHNEQQQPLNNETINGMNKLQWLWMTGAELYATKWSRDWGTTPSTTLENLFSKLSAEQIKLGFGECIKMAQNGKEWPPVPITFISMCKVAGLDVEGSYARFTNRKQPKDKAEQVTRSEIGFNIKAMSMNDAERKWAKVYTANYQKMKDGFFDKPEAPALTEHSSVKDTDIMRDNFKPACTASAKLMDRLHKIRDSKK